MRNSRRQRRGVWQKLDSFILGAAKRLPGPETATIKRPAAIDLGGATLLYAEQTALLANNHASHAYVFNALEAMRKAHIKISVFTQLHPGEAKVAAISAGLGGHQKELSVVTEREIRSLNETQIGKLARQGNVIFSRLTPENKKRLVRLAQEDGESVVALGKDSAHMSAITLAHAIREGRVALQNIRKTALCALLIGAVIFSVVLASIVAASLFYIPPAISILQVLAVGPLAALPMAALVYDKATSAPMKSHSQYNLPGLRTLIDLAWCGLLIGALAFGNYLWFFERSGIQAQNLAAGSSIHLQATALAFLTIVICLLAYSIQNRTPNGIFNRYQLHNKLFWSAASVSICCALLVASSAWIASSFTTGVLSVMDLLCVTGAVTLFIIVREFQRHNRKHHRKAVLELHRMVHQHPKATQRG